MKYALSSANYTNNLYIVKNNSRMGVIKNLPKYNTDLGKTNMALLGSPSLSFSAYWFKPSSKNVCLQKLNVLSSNTNNRALHICNAYNNNSLQARNQVGVKISFRNPKNTVQTTCKSQTLVSARLPARGTVCACLHKPTPNSTNKSVVTPRVIIVGYKIYPNKQTVVLTGRLKQTKIDDIETLTNVLTTGLARNNLGFVTLNSNQIYDLKLALPFASSLVLELNKKRNKKMDIYTFSQMYILFSEFFFWIYNIHVGHLVEIIITKHIFNNKTRKETFKEYFLLYLKRNFIFFELNKSVVPAGQTEQIYGFSALVYKKQNLLKKIRIILKTFNTDFLNSITNKQEYRFIKQVVDLTRVTGSFKYIQALFKPISVTPDKKVILLDKPINLNNLNNLNNVNNLNNLNNVNNVNNLNNLNNLNNVNNVNNVNNPNANFPWLTRFKSIMVFVGLGACYLANKTGYNPTNTWPAGPFINTVTICSISNSTRGSLPLAALSLSGKYKSINTNNNTNNNTNKYSTTGSSQSSFLPSQNLLSQTLNNTGLKDQITNKRACRPNLTVTVKASMGAESLVCGSKSALLIKKLSEADQKVFKELVLDPLENKNQIITTVVHAWVNETDNTKGSELHQCIYKRRDPKTPCNLDLYAMDGVTLLKDVLYKTSPMGSTSVVTTNPCFNMDGQSGNEIITTNLSNRCVLLSEGSPAMYSAAVTYSQKNQITPIFKEFLIDLVENNELFNNTLKQRFNIPSEIDWKTINKIDLSDLNANLPPGGKTIALFSSAKLAKEKDIVVSNIKQYLEFKKGLKQQINYLENNLVEQNAAHFLTERQGANLEINSGAKEHKENIANLTTSIANGPATFDHPEAVRFNFGAATTEDFMNAGLKIGEFKFQTKINKTLINIANGESNLNPMSLVLLQGFVNDYYKESRSAALSQFVRENFNFYLKECSKNLEFKQIFQILNPSLIKSAVIVSTCQNTIKTSAEIIENVYKFFDVATVGSGASVLAGLTKPTNQVSRVYPLLFSEEFFNIGPKTNVNNFSEAYNTLTNNLHEHLDILRAEIGTIIYCYQLMEHHVVNMACIHGSLLGMPKNDFNKFLELSLKNFHSITSGFSNKKQSNDTLTPLTNSLLEYFRYHGVSVNTTRIQGSLWSLERLKKKMEGCLDEVNEIKANKNNIQNSIIANLSANSTNFASFRQLRQLTEDELTQVEALFAQGQQSVKELVTLLSNTCDTASPRRLKNHTDNSSNELKQVINGSKTTYGCLIKQIRGIYNSSRDTTKQRYLTNLKQAYIDYQKSDWCVELHKDSSVINEGLRLKTSVAGKQQKQIIERIYKIPFESTSQQTHAFYSSSKTNQAITNFGVGEVLDCRPELAGSELQNQTLLLQAGDLLVQNATRSVKTGSVPTVRKHYEDDSSLNLPLNANATFTQIRKRNVSSAPQFNSENPPFVAKPAFPEQGTPYLNAAKLGATKPAKSWPAGQKTSSVSVTENQSKPVLAIEGLLASKTQHQSWPAGPNPR